MSGVWWTRLALARGRRLIQGPDAATRIDRVMMARAIALAREAARRGEVPVGAVVYEGATGAVVGEGFNLREQTRDPSAHAEVLAIVRAAKKIGDWRLNHLSLAVTLEPCPMCAGLIVYARVGRVVFGADDPKAGAVRSLYSLCGDPRLNHRPRVIGGVRADESALELRKFFQKRRRS